MIPSYYDDPQLRARLLSAAQQLVGTPFFANSEAPGRDGGIDCVRAINFMHRTCGAIPKIDIPRQVTDWGKHSEHSLLIEAFENWPALKSRFVLIWQRGETDITPEETELFRAGDVLCFQDGLAAHHGGVFLDKGEFLHVLKAEGAHRSQLTATMRGRRITGYLVRAYRPLPIG